MTVGNDDTKREFTPLYDPRSVAVIGATNSWNKWGFSTFTSALNGFRGKVYPVNNSEEIVVGRRAYKSVLDIPDDELVDLAIFVIPAPAIPKVMEDCVKKGVKAGVIISAGFSETGEEGRKLQDEVVRIARSGNLIFIGPNCMGYYSASSELRAFMFPIPILPGPIGFVSQGGNVGGAIVTTATDRNIGFRRYISCGCTADIQIEEYIESFGNDPEIKVILAYIEGLDDGDRFVEKVRKVTREKPVIALKPGRTNAATKAIRSHSGTIAGSSSIWDSAFKKAGVIRADTPDELVDIAVGYLTQPLPEGRNVAIMTPGGSYGVLCADACASMGLNVIDLSQETVAAFDKIFPPRWSKGNPVDPAGDRNFTAYLKAPEMLLDLNEVDSLIFMGFDGFSSFPSLVSSMNHDFAGMFKNTILPLVDIEKVNQSASSDGHAHKTSRITRLMRSLLFIFFSIFGTSKKEDIQEFADQIARLITSDFVDPTIFQVFSQIVNVTDLNDIDDQMVERLLNSFQPLLEALILKWIHDYNKPIITTNFTEGPTTLKGGKFYSFSSGKKAALVLSKLVEYSEYLKKKEDGASLVK
ncbi:MAG: CoA-binding protein [Thermodesulfobacteriota bacterium]|nr:CoA-binding protein [Thermodesulfobacteriota bacterium]